MFGFYLNKETITKEFILSHLSQEQIFEYYLNEEVELGRKYTAPYRVDHTPSCFFDYFNEILYFYDFADTQTSKDVFAFVMALYDVDFRESLNVILNDLIINGNHNLERKVLSPLIAIKPKKRDRKLQYVKRDWNLDDAIFWNKYQINKQTLINDGVFPISSFFGEKKNGDYFSIGCNTITYAYTQFHNNRVKIYAPKSKHMKWITNCSSDDVGGIDDLPEKAELLIITKSYKDYRVLKNLKLNVIWFQSETIKPDDNILENLTQRFDKIVIWFDRDPTGYNNGINFAKHINTFKHCCIAISIPSKKEVIAHKVKDPSDYIAAFGKDKLIELIRELIFNRFVKVDDNYAKAILSIFPPSKIK